MSGLLDLAPPLLAGLRTTLAVAAGAALVGAALAVVVGLARLSRLAAARAGAVLYIEFFRGTSALVQLFWIYFALPLLGVDVGPMAAGIAALGLNAGAYGAEVVRGAIQAVPRGQYEAALALGFTDAQRMRRVILPQAAVAMLPPAGNLLIELLKNTALVSLITLSDLTFRAQTLRAATLRSGEIFALVLALYFAVALVLAALVRAAERRVSWGREAAAVR